MEAPRLGDERPETIRFQPLPYQTIPVYLNGHTAISRLWLEGEPQRCQLCADCHASKLNCIVIVPFIVERELTPAFSTRGLRATEDGGLPGAEGDGGLIGIR